MRYPVDKSILAEKVKQILPEITELRHRFHSIPEMGCEEFKTAEEIRRIVGGTGVKVFPPILGTDTVCLLSGRGAGKNVTLRADIDALPIEDRSGKPWASTHPGFCHACGHDGHIAMLCGAMKVLSGLTESFNGSVRFVFQPAEEKLGGGKMLVEKGLLDEEPRPDAVFALHGWPGVQEGVLASRAGEMMAAADRFVLKVKGKGGHGARPHATVDPIVASAEIVSSLQSVVSRNVDPVKPAVVSVCTIHGGNADNVIPDEVILQGTTRYFEARMKELISRRMEEIIAGVCKAHGASYEFEYNQGYIPLVNDETMTEFSRSVVRSYLGEKAWMEGLSQTMGGEDFSFYLQKVPGTFLRLGLGENQPGL
ncbi:MAG TPA: M20 family metallopeptidase, partial [Spirochaetia bacterium]|nr:M20 family metallopeptidase [Spirochaetia bacterium]